MKILAVATKELRQIVRDPLTLVLLLGMPAFMLVIFGYAVSFDVEDVTLGVQDRDKSAASRALVDRFVTSGRFQLAALLPTRTDLDRALEMGAIRLAVVIPQGFGSDLAAGRPAAIQLLIDGTNSQTATTILGYATAILEAADAERRARLLETAGAASVLEVAIDYEPRVFYNPELLSSRFLVPGLIGFILMVTATLSTALSVVREAERGTLEQLRMAPIRTLQILVGKILPYLAIELASLALILVVARLLFAVEVRGSYLDLFLVTLLYLVAGFSLGLLISTVARSQAIAFDMGVLSSILPTLVLSGFIFPLHNMPKVLQLLSFLVPGRYYLIALRGIILKGAGLSSYWDQLGCLTLYTGLVLTLAAVRFSRKTV